MLDSLADVVPDMNVRYKKATEILAKQGHTLPIILTGIDKAIGALEDSAREFEATQKRQFQNSVGALHKAVEQADQMIAAKQQQMEALKQEINALTQKRTADAAQISTEQAQIDHVQSRYSVVYQRISNEVLEQRTAVDQRMKAQ
jgi:phage shock protein A